MLRSVEGTAELMHLSRHFIALVLIPNIGNIDAIAASTSMAARGKMDLALTLALGSAVQVAICLMPVLVLLCWAMGLPLHLDLQVFETVVLMLAALVVNAVVRTAKSTYLEGILMLGGYLIISLAYTFHTTAQSHSDIDVWATCVCGGDCCQEA